MRISRFGAAILSLSLATALTAAAQDARPESDIDRRIRELKEQMNNRLQDLDREREAIQREFERQIERLRRDRGEPSPRIPRNLDDLMRSMERMLDRLGGLDRLMREFDERIRRLEERIPELREFRQRFPVPREWHRETPGREREFRWEFRFPPEGSKWKELERWLERFYDRGDREHY